MPKDPTILASTQVTLHRSSLEKTNNNDPKRDKILMPVKIGIPLPAHILKTHYRPIP
jgi:hypothetical protein